jgi:Flp pilus assembly pilin Flp
LRRRPAMSPRHTRCDVVRHTPSSSDRQLSTTSAEQRRRRTTMNALTNFIAAIRRDNEGQDLLEYALLVALIAIVAVAAITTAGEAVVTQFEAIAAAL